MSIVLELQQQAIDSTDVLSLLRKALLVARKLGLKDFQQWVDNELNGYKDVNSIPSYRNVHGQLKAFNPYNGWITVLVPNGVLNETFAQRKLFDAMPSLTSLLSTEKETFSMSISAEGCAILSQAVDFDTMFTLQLSFNSISNIVEQVKNKILDWAIILEENGISGEGLSFTKEEKEKAQSEPQIVNYISNFYGDVTNSQIQEGTQNSTQNRG